MAPDWPRRLFCESRLRLLASRCMCRAEADTPPISCRPPLAVALGCFIHPTWSRGGGAYISDARARSYAMRRRHADRKLATLLWSRCPPLGPWALRAHDIVRSPSSSAALSSRQCAPSAGAPSERLARSRRMRTSWQRRHPTRVELPGRGATCRRSRRWKRQGAICEGDGCAPNGHSDTRGPKGLYRPRRTQCIRVDTCYSSLRLAGSRASGCVVEPRPGPGCKVADVLVPVLREHPTSGGRRSGSPTSEAKPERLTSEARPEGP